MSDLQISVIICTHNGAARLPQTLAHLAAQRFHLAMRWEVLIVDNLSTDRTADRVREIWPAAAPAPLRVVSEPRLGVSNARQRGMEEARGELLCFVDDDNWLAPDWLQIAWDVMAANPRIGALGGINEPVCEVTPPWWFEEFRNVFATTTAQEPLGDFTHTGGALVTAGMILRRAAWDSLLRRGFQITVKSRTGKGLTTGEDSEICLALRLDGWRLYRDPRLRLKHFLPARRLDWWYLRKLHRGWGQGSVQLDQYMCIDADQEHSWKNAFRDSWQWHFLAAASEFFRHPGRVIRFPFRPMEGDQIVCQMEFYYGRLLGYLERRKGYKQSRRRVRELFADVLQVRKSGPSECAAAGK